MGLRALLCAVLVLVASAGCVPAGLRDPSTQRWEDDSAPFTTGPYLIRTRPGEMAVVLHEPRLDEDAPVVEYWPEESAGSGRGRARVVRAEEYLGLWVSVLKPLKPDTRYGYRVLSKLGETEAHTFIGHRSRGETFRFAAYGDTRTGHRVHRAVIMEMAKEQIDFVVHTGDLVETGGHEWEWDLFFQIERPLLVNRPIFPAIGNHDMSPRDLFGRMFLTTYWADSLNYYYQDWGDLRVVAVDTGIECRDGCAQNDYARQVLADGARRGMHMIISLHHPPYSSGAHGSYLGIRRAVHSLSKEFGVELVLAGHDHNYERTKSIDGVTYIVAAASGAPIRPVDKQNFSAVLRTEPHYLLVDVSARNMVARAVNLEGETFDEVVLQPNSPRGRL